MRITDGLDGKYMNLRAYLRSFIEANPEGTRLPSYARIKSEHGVSQDTLERALRELDESKLIVHKSRCGLFVSGQAKVRRIGLIFGRDIFTKDSSPVYRMLMDLICSKAARTDLRFSFFIDIPEVELPGLGLKVSQSLCDGLANKSLQGILLMAPRGPNEVEWISSFGIPMVVMGNCPGSAVGVYPDLETLAEYGMERLLAEGCRRIAMMTLHRHQREQGYTAETDAYHAVLAKAGIDFDPSLLWDAAIRPSETDALDNNNEAHGRMAIDYFMEGRVGDALPFDGLLSLDDIATRGAVKRLRELGVEPGRDFKMLSHANKGSDALAGFSEGVELAQFDLSKLSSLRLQTLEDMMRGLGPKRGQTVSLKPEIPIATGGC